MQIVLVINLLVSNRQHASKSIHYKTWCKKQTFIILLLPLHTAQYRHSFLVGTVHEWWNSLPEACVSADTMTAFQAQLRHTPWAVCTPPPRRRDVQKLSDDYWTRTRMGCCCWRSTFGPVCCSWASRGKRTSWHFASKSTSHIYCLGPYFPPVGEWVWEPLDIQSSVKLAVSADADVIQCPDQDDV